MKLAHDNIFEFECSGRQFYANDHIIGLSPSLELSEGYDGELYESKEYFLDLGRDEAWTNEEKLELADYMIDLWTRYKETMIMFCKR